MSRGKKPIADFIPAGSADPTSTDPDPTNAFNSATDVGIDFTPDVTPADFGQESDSTL